MKLYPYDMPDGIHPLAWTLLGFGLDADTINKLAAHLYDKLGVRLAPDVCGEYTYRWQVSWPRPCPEGRMAVSLGDTCKIQVPGGDLTAVEVVAGALPKGIRLEKHTGKLVGEYGAAGLYEATVRVGPTIKYDPLGSAGGPDNVDRWIPVSQTRMVPEPAPEPTKPLSDYSPQELELLIVQAQEAQRAKLIKEADDGH